MPCELLQEKIDAYVDGALPAAEARDIARHLRECSACAAEAVERVHMKRAVSMAGKAYEPAAAFREKIKKSVKGPASQGKSWAWKLVVLPAALVLILSVSMLFLVRRENSRRERVFSEVADLHIATLASATPVDVVSTDGHSVKPWFEGKIPFTFNLPELQGTDFALVGGKVAYLAQSPGAQLIYRIRKHEISVFIFQDRGVENASWASDPMSMMSFTFETWTENGLRYFVVGDVGAADVNNLSKLLRNAQ